MALVSGGKTHGSWSGKAAPLVELSEPIVSEVRQSILIEEDVDVGRD